MSERAGGRLRPCTMCGSPDIEKLTLMLQGVMPLELGRHTFHVYRCLDCGYSEFYSDKRRTP